MRPRKCHQPSLQIEVRKREEERKREKREGSVHRKKGAMAVRGRRKEAWSKVEMWNRYSGKVCERVCVRVCKYSADRQRHDEGRTLSRKA